MKTIGKLSAMFGILLGFVLSVEATQPSDMVNDIVAQLRQSNAKGLSKYFAPSVDLEILSNEKTSSKADAESVLNSFFSKNRPESVKIVHRIDSKPDYKVLVLAMTANGKSFRTSISLKNNGNGFLITEVSIDEGN